MIGSVFESSRSMFKSVFGTANDRLLKNMHPVVTEINSHESRVKEMTDTQMREETEHFKSGSPQVKHWMIFYRKRSLWCEKRAGAISKCVILTFRLIGGMILHSGIIAEMKTGEGKTLVATLAAYLNALESKGVHIVTVNDYLASRDSEWMGRLFRALGLTVGCIQHGMNDDARRRAYACDITYGTNNEFGSTI